MQGATSLSGSGSVLGLLDRVSASKDGRLPGVARTGVVIKDEELGMIILVKCPAGRVPGSGALGALA